MLLYFLENTKHVFSYLRLDIEIKHRVAIVF